MKMLHDIWVNWFEGADKSYQVCEFYEWKQSDQITLLKAVPLIKVENDFLDYVENSLQSLPDTLLENIKGRTYYRTSLELKKMDGCCILTDGKKALAFNADGNNIPIKKSRLTPRQELTVLEFSKEINTTKYNFKNQIEDLEFSISFSLESMLGLTRNERSLKELLMLSLHKILNENNQSKILYYYSEWNPKEYKIAKELNLENLKEKFLAETSIGWSKNHENFCKVAVKEDSFLEKIFHEELNNFETNIKS